LPENRDGLLAYSAVVGSIVVLISETLLAGKPPWLACSRTIFSFDQEKQKYKTQNL
jgi:hypothetical protein